MIDKAEVWGLYARTMNNCKFYEKENKPLKLLNEIGVLRGIAYCLETCGEFTPCDKDFQHFIEIQEELKKAEN